RFVVGQCLLCGDLNQDLFQFRDHFSESHPAHYERILNNAAERLKRTQDEIKSQIWLFSSAFHTFDVDQ
ncbi:hypothetical protein PENTCL1PPCAC_19995, partial [Pristionchus entomophagus]